MMVLTIIDGFLSALTDPSVLINGILIGGVYASMAIGFSMIWGIVGVINISHGDILMLGAFTTWSVMNFVGGAENGSFSMFILGLIIAMIVLGVLGYIIQRVLINRVMRGDEILTLLLTFGLALIMHYTALLYWGATPRSIELNLPGPSTYDLFGVVVPAPRLIIFLLAVALTVIFYFFLQRTRTGRAIRAAGQNEQAAALIGIDIDHIYGITFAISSALVAAIGGLVGMALTFQPQMGLPWTLKSFVVVVIGGLGSIMGALVGGLFLGIAEHMGAAIWGTGLVDAIAFSVLVVFLLVKPHGFFGETEEDH